MMAAFIIVLGTDTLVMRSSSRRSACIDDARRVTARVLCLLRMGRCARQPGGSSEQNDQVQHPRELLVPREIVEQVAGTDVDVVP